MPKELSVLYIGSLNEQSNSFRRYKALFSILKNVEAVHTDPYLLMKYFSGIQHHLNIGPGIFFLNRRIRKLFKEKKYDVVLVDNKSYLTKKTLRFIKCNLPSARIASLLIDDPFGKFTKSWRLVKQTVSLYDIFFVQRKVNIAELMSLGAKRVELCYRSFDPGYNIPLLLANDEYKNYHTPVGFVGTYENVRASYIAYLIKNNIPVSVTGNDWPKGEHWNIIQPHYKGPSVYGDAYIKTINGMDIALHFLRHANRDEQDSRTFEIPACKVFMLAERSELHTELFKENEEAVFFDSKEELLSKVNHYLADSKERERIALNGYNRCVTGGYSHKERMKAVIEKITGMRL